MSRFKIIQFMIGVVTIFYVYFAADLNAAIAEPYGYTVGGYIASSSLMTLEKAMRLAEEKKFDQLMVLITEEKIIFLEENQKVELLKKLSEKKMIYIKDSNTQNKWWTVEKAIKKECW